MVISHTKEHLSQQTLQFKRFTKSKESIMPGYGMKKAKPKAKPKAKSKPKKKPAKKTYGY